MGQGLTAIAKGAEADLYSARFSDVFFTTSTFREVIIKRRVPKGYRIPELDLQIRTQRTVAEARILAEARRIGANVPAVLGVWRKHCVLVMERIEGTRLKELLNTDVEGRLDACREAGRQLGILHRGGIVHGDPTTSNMILRNRDVYVIDFGLAEFSDSVEKRAVDVHLLKTAMASTHFHLFSAYYSSALEGYESEMGKDASTVLDRLSEVEKRGRYVER